MAEEERMLSLLPEDPPVSKTAAEKGKDKAPAQNVQKTPQPRGKSEAEAESGYRVLARKYRPTHFEELVGQDAMVRTLSNAFAAKRVAHAFMLTGMRGVGKTTTARILARALNYTNAEGEAEPSVTMPERRAHCEAILESRHPDVIEMDAASRTGIDDVREIIDAVHYRPMSAPHKVYIIDEVHMLSKAAFNGLLKTLEEPPKHVTFIFATTELRKVPLTVLSRCQRFDLRRLRHEEMLELLSRIAREEKVEAEKEALALIARAAEGSARDALSLLDQAIAHGEGRVEKAALLDMLGLASRGGLLDLYHALLAGDAPQTLSLAREHYDKGGDPLAILSDLADMTHWFMRHKIAPAPEDSYEMADDVREQAEAMADEVSIARLSLLWQMLLKGMEETRFATRPFAAAEMALMRMIYIAGLPDAKEAMAILEEAKPPKRSRAAGGGNRGGGHGGFPRRGAPPHKRRESAGRQSAGRKKA